MTRLAWLSDTHFNFLPDGATGEFGKSIAPDSDCCVITGDIAEGDSVVRLLNEFHNGYGKPTYFVLGNHDLYNSGIVGVDRALLVATEQNANLHRLSRGGVYEIGKTQLCGVDGWYDYQAGIISERLHVHMTDWLVIEGFKKKYAHYMACSDSAAIIKYMRYLGKESALDAGSVLSDADPSKPVLFATHVPPFAESSWHLGKRSDATHLPYFTNIALGFALNEWADANPGTDMTTLCGHCHSRGTYQARPNHLVLTAAAEYYRPAVERIFEV